MSTLRGLVAIQEALQLETFEWNELNYIDYIGLQFKHSNSAPHRYYIISNFVFFEDGEFNDNEVEA